MEPIRSGVFLYIILLCLATVLCLFDVEEINTVNYGIDILETPVMRGEDLLDSMVFLTSKHGQDYQCSYHDKSREAELKEKENEKAAMDTGIPELLKPMENTNCLVHTKSWWTYEFCFGKYIKQYHVEDGQVTGVEVFLGHYESDYDWSNTTQLRKQRSWTSRYHSQHYVNGTECDLTNKPRRTEVQFVCDISHGDFISRVEETETCVYTIVVKTPRICNHPYLKAPPAQKVVPITCNPLLTPDQYHQYEAHLQHEKLVLKQLQQSMVKEPDQSGSKALQSDISPEGDDTDAVAISDGEERDSGATEDDSLESLLSHSLMSGLKKALGDEKQDMKVRMRSRKIKNVGDLDSAWKAFLEPEEQEATEDQKDSKQDDEKDEEGDEDGIVEDEDDAAILAEFEKGLDELAESDATLEELKSYTKELERAISDQFDEIIEEAKEDLEELDLGFDEEADTEVALKTLSTTLKKMMKKFNDKTSGEKAKDGVSTEAVSTEQQTDSETEEADEQEEDEFEEDDEYIMKEDAANDMVDIDYEIDYGEHKIHVKIFTGAEYYEDAAELLEDGGALNKMLVAVFNTNTEEVAEKNRQQKMEDSYNFVWNGDQKSQSSQDRGKLESPSGGVARMEHSRTDNQMPLQGDEDD